MGRFPKPARKKPARWPTAYIWHEGPHIHVRHEGPHIHIRHEGRQLHTTHEGRQPGGFIPWVAVESGDAVLGSPSSPVRGGDDGGDERRGAWPAAEAPPPPFSFLLPSPSPPFSFFLLPSPLLHLPSLLYSPAPPLLHSGGSGAGGSRAGHHMIRHMF